MYLKHYNLKTKPFNLSPGPKFLWLGEKHSEALATLKYGVQSDMGFLLMTGDVGVGKTALIHRLISSLDPSTIVAHITDPGVSNYDFFRLLADGYDIAPDFRNKAEFLIELEKFLRQSYRNNKRVLLIVDEAQRLNHKLLDEIRVLSNIELSDRKLINIFFVGQPEFIELVSEKKNRAIKQRVAINYHIHPLTENETGQYIEHRLKMAGASQPIFKPDTFSEIFRVTGGFPRAINILCDHALVEGYVSGSTSIDSAMIKNCEQELNIRAGSALNKPVRPTPAEATRPETITTPPSTIPTSPTPPKSKGRSLFVGVGIVIVILLSYYLLRLEPRLSLRNNAQKTISESAGPPTDQVVSEQAQAPPKSETTVADPPAENVTPAPATTEDEMAAPDHQPAIRIAQAPLPAEGLPTSGPPEAGTSPNTIPPAVVAPTSPPGWANWQQTDEESRLSVKDDAPPPDGPATVSADSTQPAPDASTEDQQVDNQAGAADKTVKGAAVAAVLAESQPKPPVTQGKPSSPATNSSNATADKKGKTDRPTAAQSQVTSPETSPSTPEQRSTKKPAAEGTAPTPTRAPEKVPPSKSPEPSLAAKKKAAPAQGSGLAASVIRMEDRLRSFLQLYCSTYAEKDLANFTTFFAANAIENGKPFKTLLPKYERNFKFIETIQYRIELQQFSYDNDKELVTMEGDFFLKWLPPDKKWRENSGTITMSLKENGPTFLVQRLDYQSSRSKKQ